MTCESSSSLAHAGTIDLQMEQTKRTTTAIAVAQTRLPRLIETPAFEQRYKLHLDVRTTFA